MSKRVLIGSPIKQKSAVLKEFLSSIENLEQNSLDIDYYFIDDNDEFQSTHLLQEFAIKHKNTLIQHGNKTDYYRRDEDTHYWNEKLIWKIANYKNQMIDYMLQHEYDYLFLIDSDLVLHPLTLAHLVSLDKEIVSEIFWTKWKQHSIELPQVWLHDEYTLYPIIDGEQITEEEVQRRTQVFLDKLRKPGVYEVGGLGACTLFSRQALEKGVNFSKIKNLTFWGEDRHLCIRAGVLGVSLFVDTHFPAYHIYRTSDLKGVALYKEEYQKKIRVRYEDQVLHTIINGMNAYQKLATDESTTELYSFFSQSLLSMPNIVEFLDGIISYPYVSSLSGDYKEAIVHFTWVSKKYGNSRWTARVLRNDLCWKIEAIIEDRQVIQTSKIQKNIKKITLVHTSNSGSSTMALYKNMPVEVNNNYEVELIQQDYTEAYIKKVLQSDVVVITEGNHHFNKKMYNPNQVIIDLWHGFPLKAMGYVDKSEVNKNRISRIWEQVDYTASYSSLYNEVMNKCIQIDPNRYIITGQPRNDLLFKTGSRSLLHTLLGKKDEGKQIIFYMPTYRQTSFNNRTDGRREWGNLFDFGTFNQDEFTDFLRKMDCELIVKLHPAEEAKWSGIIKKMEGVQLLSDSMLKSAQVDLYEVLGAAALLITDYSSVYFDYLLLDRPVIFTPTDLKEYEESRGFLLQPYDEWTPGSKVYNQTQLEKEIKQSLNHPSKDKEHRERIRNIVHTYQDNQSSERFWEFIQSI